MGGGRTADAGRGRPGTEERGAAGASRWQWKRWRTGRPTGPEPVPEAPEASGAKRAGQPFLHRRGPLSSAVRWLVLLAGLVLTVVFAVGLARVTLVPVPGARNLVHPNFHLGASLRGYLDQPAVRAAAQQVGGNVLLGMPFGVLLPVLFPRLRSVLAATALTALVMVTVEAAQGLLVEGRAFDVDDVLLNTFGALLAHLLVGRRIGRALYARP
ncbi:VanZ family protein [Kitasatospora sp. NA04385]|uniref:VanZ family protein n=1 Tax=Kitasatospora sp. NA04385 TaxID=2742135 RepID=UPI0020CAA1F3|nr:VanZ family protein [Kitasatospora sp. NA04385]